MDSRKHKRYTYRTGTEPSERNVSYALQFQEYTHMLNRLNLQNQSLSMNMIQLINENNILKRQLHQNRLEHLINSQPSSQLRSPRRYISRYNKSSNKISTMQRSDTKQIESQQRPKTNSAYVANNNNKQAKPSTVLKSTTMIEELSEQKFQNQKKKGLYLSKQISHASQGNKKQANLQTAGKNEKKQDKETNPQSPQKNDNKNVIKGEQSNRIQSPSKKTNSPYRIPMKRVGIDNTSSYSKLRKDHLESMYGYLYSPIKTYNQPHYDRP